MKREKGFTFIELLVVITIAALMTAAATVGYTSISRRSRDTRRRTDMETIRAALELYRSENGSYPLSVTEGESIGIGGTTYLNPVPGDPKEGSYVYIPGGSNMTYTLTCTLESEEECSYINP